MAGHFNPNAPDVAGLEWGIVTGGVYSLGAWAQRIRSYGAETINRLDAMVGAQIAADTSQLLAEIIPAGSEIPSGTVTTTTFHPDHDTIDSTMVDQTASTTGLWAAIDEGVDTPNFTDYITNTAPGAVGDCTIGFPTGAFSTSARILNVKFRLVGASVGSSGGHITVDIDVGGQFDTPVGVSLGVVFTTIARTIDIDCGEINPLTGLPWRPADIIDFHSGGSSGINIIIPFGQPSQVRIYAIDMVVTWQSVENRVAAATRQQSDTVNLFPKFGAFPSGSSWSKPASGDFSILFRQPNNQFVFGNTTFGLQWVDAPGAFITAPPGIASARPVLDAYGQVLSITDFTPATDTASSRAAAVLLWKAGPTLSDDSLPYAWAADAVHQPDINSGQTIKSRFTPGGTEAYGFIKLFLNPGIAIQDLIVKIKRNSDNVQFGSTEHVAVADVLALPSTSAIGGYYLWVVEMAASASLVSGTQYYVELSTTDTTAATKGWRTILAGDSIFGGGSASYGGTTDFPTVGATTRTQYDIPMKIIAPLPAVTGQAAVVVNKPNNVLAPAQNCVPAHIQAVLITWSGTALGVFFDHYEIARKRPTDANWTSIAWITSSELTTQFLDYECARGAEYQYRIRVVRADGVDSFWSAPTASVICQPMGCEMIFVSNEQPGLGVAFDYEPGQDYDFLAASRDQIVQIYGADFSVAFMECEDPGLTFPVTLTVNFATTAAVDDIAIFGPLRTLCRLPLSYICVLDYVGNRFQAHVQASKGHWVEPGHQYHADVQVTEVSNVPSIARA